MKVLWKYYSKDWYYVNDIVWNSKKVWVFRKGIDLFVKSESL